MNGDMNSESAPSLGGIGLFPKLGDFQSDFVDYGIGGASAFAANAAWGKVESSISTAIPASAPLFVHQYGPAALQVVAGVVLGPLIARKGGKLKWVGAGAAIGLVGGGLLKIAKTSGVLDAIPVVGPAVKGLGSYDPILMAGASLDTNSYAPGSNADFRGAQLGVEAPSRFGGIGGSNAGISSVFSS